MSFLTKNFVTHGVPNNIVILISVRALKKLSFANDVICRITLVKSKEKENFNKLETGFLLPI